MRKIRVMKKWIGCLTVLALLLAPCALAHGESLFEMLGGESGVDYGNSAPTLASEAEEEPSGAGSPNAKLTLMMYLCGSNLESRSGCATRDVVEMANSGYDPDQVNIVIMAGGSTAWQNDIVAAGSTGIYSLKGNYLIPMQVDAQPQNMGDPATLTNFLKYSVEHYPAERFALVLWDHGGGSVNGICNDENFNGDGLDMHELVSALESSPISGKKLEWIGFDACLMASAEVARLMAPFASYMVASEESEPGTGWNYSFLNGIESDATGAVTGQRIVDAYFDTFKDVDVGSMVLTMSCIDLSKMGKIVDKSSALFQELEDELDAGGFANASRARRSARAFGRDEEVSKYDFDLVDMGNLAEMYGHGEAVAPALEEGVIYTRSNVDGCTGLSLYHPFYNPSMYSACAIYYSTIGISSEYNSYVNKFYNCMTDHTASTNWGSLSAALGGAVRDVRTILSLQLTGEQLAELGDMQLIAFEQGADPDTYHLVSTQEAEISDDGVVSGEYVHTNLFIVDDEGNPAWELPLLYTVRDDGTYHVQVQLAREGEESVDARLICSRDEETNEVRVEMVWLYDEVSGVYSPRDMDPLESYDTITFTQINRTLTKGEDGALLPFAQWEEASVEQYSCAVNSPWHLAFVRDYLDVDGLSVAFEITDIYNNRHTSTLVPVEAAPVDEEGLVVTYDDLDLLYIDAESVSLTPSSDGTGLRLSAQLMNISGAEAIVEAGNVRVNGVALSASATVYGTGESDGLMALESQMLMLPLDLTELGDASAIETIELDLRLVDANGQELGVVPVSIQANLPL